jgi:hypothetical protein
MTNSIDKATPRPWKIFEGGSQDVVDIVNGKNEMLCRCKGSFIGSRPLKEAQANASLIVKAVNNHEALLEACREAYEALGKDRNWNISDLRLKTLKSAIDNATQR